MTLKRVEYIKDEDVYQGHYECRECDTTLTKTLLNDHFEPDIEPEVCL